MPAGGFRLTGFDNAFNSPKIGPIVEGANRKLWMDRNLGASRVASAYNDSEAYGDLFQLGRLDDGHQDRGSVTTRYVSKDAPGAFASSPPG